MELQKRADLLTVTAHFLNNKGFPDLIRILMAPEDWDQLFNSGKAWVDVTNNERACEISPTEERFTE